MYSAIREQINLLAQTLVQHQTHLSRSEAVEVTRLREKLSMALREIEKLLNEKEKLLEISNKLRADLLAVR